MFTQSEYVAVQMNRDAYDRARQEAENLRKLRQAGLIQVNPITRAACCAAGALGRLLVAAGQRLERVEAAVQPA